MSHIYRTSRSSHSSQPPRKKHKSSDPPPEEIIFDPSARQEYLTGFHKRKQQRIKHAQQVAVQREREAKALARKETRREREQEIQERLKAVEMAETGEIGAESEDEDDDHDCGGVGGAAGQEERADEGLKGRVEPREDEYIDEGKFATVTVEEVEVSREGLHSLHNEDGLPLEDSAGSSERKSTSHQKSNSQHDGEGKKVDARAKKTKKRKRKFKYESKTERSATKQKQKLVRRVKAAKRRE